MALPTSYVKVSGNWKQVNGIWHKVSGAWKEFELVYNKVSGTWEIVYFKTIPDGVVMLMQGNTPSTESGWTYSSGLADNRYVKIATSYGSTGGSSTHTHYLAMATSSVSNHAGNDQKNPVYAHMNDSTHYHIASHTHTSSNGKSRVIYRPYLGGKYIPANAVLIWTDPTGPASLGVEQHATLSYYLLYLGATYGITSQTHADTYSGYSGYVSSSLTNTSRDYGSSSADYGQHRHTINHTHSTISVSAALPPSRGFRMFKVSSDMYSVPSGVCFLYTGSGTVPEGYTDLSPAWNNRYLTLMSGTGNRNNTHGSAYHKVPSSNYNTSTIQNYTRTHGLQENDRYVIANHTHPFNHGHSSSTHGYNNPVYRYYRIIRKN